MIFQMSVKPPQRRERRLCQTLGWLDARWWCGGGWQMTECRAYVRTTPCVRAGRSRSWRHYHSSKLSFGPARLNSRGIESWESRVESLVQESVSFPMRDAKSQTQGSLALSNVTAKVITNTVSRILRHSFDGALWIWISMYSIWVFDFCYESYSR